MEKSNESIQNKKCECGHFKKDHLWMPEFEPNHLIGYALVGKFHSTVQEDRGMCKICTCQKYKSQSKIRPKSIKYPKRQINEYESEKRCAICGRLLSNHGNVNHEFQ